MSKPPQSQKTADDDLRAIPKWADRYARNRVLQVLLQMVVGVVVGALLGGLSLWVGSAWHRNLPLGVVLLVMDLALCVAWVWLMVWLSLSHRGNTVVTSANQWLYRNEGVVSVAAPAMHPTRLDKAVFWTFGILVLATVILAFCTDPGLGIRYMQPISAVYVVPFMVYLCYRQSAFSTSLMLLWPGLYALHAIMVLTGVPLFANINPGLSVFLSVQGYGLVAVLVAHLYSRYALRKLKRLAGHGSPS